MSGKSVRGDVYTQRRLKPVTLISTGLISPVCEYVCVRMSLMTSICVCVQAGSPHPPVPPFMCFKTKQR